MKKICKIEDLDCAHCAQKMEDAIRKLDGVISVNVNFLSQRLTVEAPDDRMNEILAEAVKICRKIEPDCRIIL